MNNGEGGDSGRRKKSFTKRKKDVPKAHKGKVEEEEEEEEACLSKLIPSFLVPPPPRQENPAFSIIGI